MITKSRLAIILSTLNVFTDPKVRLEQYPTDSEIAADILWNAVLQDDIVDKTRQKYLDALVKLTGSRHGIQ